MSKKKYPNPLVCHGHTRPIVELQYSLITPDGYFIASASKDGSPMLRNGETGDWIGTFQGHKGAVWACVLNSPALVAATASADYTARVWDALTGDQLHQFEHPSVVRSVNFSKDDSKIVTGGFDKKIRVFDLNKPESEAVVSAVCPDKVRNAVWSQDSNIIISAYIDKPHFELWDMRSWSIVRTVETGGCVTSIDISADGRYITTADGTYVKVWDGSSYSEVKSLQSSYGVESASYCPDKNVIAAGGGDMWVYLYNATTLEELDVNKGHHGPVHCVRFSPCHDAYASGSEDGTIRIWQIPQQQEDSSQQQHQGALEGALGNGEA